MKTIIFSIICSLLLHSGRAQSIPSDSLYLGKIPPANSPQKFDLHTSAGFHAIERIAISDDGKNIFYSENNGYEKSSLSRIKYYRYVNNKWIGPVVLFEGAACPALSVTGDTIFFEKGGFEWFSARMIDSWTDPIKFNTKIPYWHYLQIINSCTFYAAMKNAQGKIGTVDWSRILIKCGDTIITSLGKPINTAKDNLDFFISRDESFIIFASDHTGSVKYGYSDLYISFRTMNNFWTTPKNLGEIINDPAEARWGPFVSSDNKYLFYSHGSKPDYSDAGTKWVRIDNVVESLKTANH